MHVKLESLQLYLCCASTPLPPRRGACSLYSLVCLVYDYVLCTYCKGPPHVVQLQGVCAPSIMLAHCEASAAPPELRIDGPYTTDRTDGSYTLDAQIPTHISDFQACA